MKLARSAIVCLLLCLANQAVGDAPDGGIRLQGPVDIRSDSLLVQKKAHQAVFSGNVKVVQADLVIRCAKLVVSYSDKPDQPDKIVRMVFSGGVSIEQRDRQGHCEQADYDRVADVIVCTGKPWVVEGDDRVEGKRIEYLLARDEVRVIHPRAVINLPADDSHKRGHKGENKQP